MQSLQVVFPDVMSAEAVDLCKGLWVHNPCSRLGAGRHGFDDLQAAPFSCCVHHFSYCAPRF